MHDNVAEGETNFTFLRDFWKGCVNLSAGTRDNGDTMKDVAMDEVLTSTEGQTGLPRYFARVFEKLQSLPRGRIDMVLPDGRRFRVDGPAPGNCVCFQ